MKKKNSLPFYPNFLPFKAFYHFCKTFVQTCIWHFLWTLFLRNWKLSFWNGPTLAYFCLFSLFSTNSTIFTTNQCQSMSCPSSVQCRNSNPWPLKHELSPVTTRPGLLPNQKLISILKLIFFVDVCGSPCVLCLYVWFLFFRYVIVGVTLLHRLLFFWEQWCKTLFWLLVI